MRTKPRNWRLFERCRQARGGGNTYLKHVSLLPTNGQPIPFLIDPAGKRSRRGSLRIFSVESHIFEAAKERFYTTTFVTEDEARQYIAGSVADHARPWIRRTDVKPM